MPPQLLSPAGLGEHDSMSGRSRISPASEDHARAGVSSLLYPGGPSSGAGLSRRPPVKRTASTADVHEHIMDMLNPSKQADEIARLNSINRAKHGRSSSIGARSSSDDDDEDMSSDGIGVLEDWEPEEDSPQRGPTAHDDPFTTTPPAALASSSSMMLDGPRELASPSPATRRGNLSKLGGQTPRKACRHTMDSDDDMDDASNNPFLSRTADGPPRAPTKKQKTAAPHADKISYVFRGKRITYDAPLESLFPPEDEDDAGLESRMKSGPRVLFPAHPKPVSPSNPTSLSLSTPQKQANVSPDSSTARKALALHLMQTPRRQPAATSTPSADQQHILAGGERKKPDEEPARFIPPTPASLPQKTKEQRQLERERLHGAMRGLHAAPHQQNEHARQRRYGPYPPR